MKPNHHVDVSNVGQSKFQIHLDLDVFLAQMTHSLVTFNARNVHQEKSKVTMDILVKKLNVEPEKFSDHSQMVNSLPVNLIQEWLLKMVLNAKNVEPFHVLVENILKQMVSVNFVYLTLNLMIVEGDVMNQNAPEINILLLVVNVSHVLVVNKSLINTHANLALTITTMI